MNIRITRNDLQLIRDWQRQFKSQMTVASPPRKATKLGIVETKRASACSRLNIYRHAYQARLFESLQEDFAGLRKMLGVRRFNRLIRSFIRAIPSHTHTLAEYSSYLPAYLKAQQKLHRLSERAIFRCELDLRKIILSKKPEVRRTKPIPQISSESVLSVNPLSEQIVKRAGRWMIWKSGGEVHELKLSSVDTVLLSHIGLRCTLTSLANRISRKHFSGNAVEKSIRHLVAHGIVGGYR